MIALVFAAGCGTRLKPWTEQHPKALVPVGGVPMLERVLRRIEAFRPRRIVVNVHHFAQQIMDYLAVRPSDTEIVISDESGELLETGGGLLKARDLLDAAPDEPILIHNADILTDISLEAMIAHHTRHEALATLLVSDRRTSRYLVVNNEGRIVGWTNVDTGEVKGIYESGMQLRAFDGVHVVSPRIFEPLKAYAEGRGVRKFSITDFYIASCAQSKIMAYEPCEAFAWYDIGTPEKLARAEAYLSQHG